MTAPLTIALDFDNTYTADPLLWQLFLANATICGHTVYIVTMRNKEIDFHEEFKFLADRFGVTTVFCDGHPKKEICAQFDIHPNIWIDDMPEGIYSGSAFTPQELESWREDQKTN